METTHEIELPGGSIRGLRIGQLFRARGIKYANARRFETPKMLESWDHTLDCTRPASICPQNPSRLDFVTGNITQGREMSEDCLHLSICAPLDGIERHSKLPVMVFLHGGAYISGAGDLDCYSPHALASRGVVCVVVTYRLGIFGFCPAQDVAPANLGILDQITAFEWVQKNISCFGGDPSRVTAVGQSVGAYSIFCMMACGGAGKLFQRAILHSSCFGWPVIPEDKSVHLEKLAWSLLKEESGLLSTQTLLDIQKKIQMEGKSLGVPFACWPRFGQHPLPELASVEQRLKDAAPKCPILIGWVKDEGAAFVPMSPWYPTWSRIPIIGSLMKPAMFWWSGGQEFIWPSQKFHQRCLQNGGKSSTFSFIWHPTGNELGSTHCIDMPFILGSWDAWSDAPMLRGSERREVVDSVGNRMKDAWADFIIGRMDSLKEHLTIDESFVCSSL